MSKDGRIPVPAGGGMLDVTATFGLLAAATSRIRLGTAGCGTSAKVASGADGGVMRLARAAWLKRSVQHEPAYLMMVGGLTA